MVNVYVHVDVEGLPDGVLDDVRFLEAVWRELPDAVLSGHCSTVSITLSQSSLSTDRAVHLPARPRRARPGSLGYRAAGLHAGAVVREGWRDDLDVIRSAVRWHVCRIAQAGCGLARRARS